MQEIYKDIPGYEGLYQVSSIGNIISLNYNRTGVQRVLKYSLGKKGYPYVVFSKGTNRRTMKIHRLVAQAFIPNPENKPQVNHKNGIKTDNRVENLEFNTSKENISHAWKIGLSKSTENNYFKKNHPCKGKFGACNPGAKKVIQYSKEGFFIKEWGSISDAARSLGISSSTIGNCLSGILKTGGGFNWKSYT